MAPPSHANAVNKELQSQALGLDAAFFGQEMLFPIMLGDSKVHIKLYGEFGANASHINTHVHVMAHTHTCSCSTAGSKVSEAKHNSDSLC